MQCGELVELDLDTLGDLRTAVEVGGGVGGSCTGDTDVSESGDSSEEPEELLEDAMSIRAQQARGRCTSGCQATISQQPNHLQAFRKHSGL